MKAKPSVSGKQPASGSGISTGPQAFGEFGCHLGRRRGSATGSRESDARGVAKGHGLLTWRRKQAAHGGPHIGGQSEDHGDGQGPEGKVEERAHGPTSGNRSDCSPAGIWRSFRTARDTSRASERIRSQSSPNRVRRTQHNPSPASSMATTSRACILRP